MVDSAQKNDKPSTIVSVTSKLYAIICISDPYVVNPKPETIPSLRFALETGPTHRPAFQGLFVLVICAFVVEKSNPRSSSTPVARQCGYGTQQTSGTRGNHLQIWGINWINHLQIWDKSLIHRIYVIYIYICDICDSICTSPLARWGWSYHCRQGRLSCHHWCFMFLGNDMVPSFFSKWPLDIHSSG